jgi:hypothetical protein
MRGGRPIHLMLVHTRMGIPLFTPSQTSSSPAPAPSLHACRPLCPLYPALVSLSCPFSLSFLVILDPWAKRKPPLHVLRPCQRNTVLTSTVACALPRRSLLHSSVARARPTRDQPDHSCCCIPKPRVHQRPLEGLLCYSIIPVAQSNR